MAHTRWPSVDDYTGALLTPQTSFDDPDLQQAIALDERGEPAGDQDPRSWVGGAAVVFRMRSLRHPEIEWAVKCFKKPNRDRQLRYQLLAKHLVELPDHKRKFMVPFFYRRDQEESGSEPRGILVDDEWFPIVRMQWVDGQTLRDIVVPRLQNRTLFSNLATLWERLARGLSDAGMAHLDLQHGNVLWVARDQNRFTLKLVDYDGMWIGPLAGLPSGELGVAHYQHPDRHPELRGRLPYGPEADRFSHLVIYTAIRALALDGPARWRRYDSGENLLFTRTDFQACRENGPARRESALLQELWDQADEELRALAGRLILASHGPLESTPAFEAVVADGQVKPLAPAEGEQIEDLCPWLPRRYRRKRPPDRKIGTTISNSLGIQFAWVPPGDSWLGGGGGSQGTKKFTLSQGLWCGVYPVTQEEWKAIMGDEPSHFKGNPRYPVESVSYNDVEKFIEKLNQQCSGDGLLYRLPTEEEWEYVCRGRPISQEQSKYYFYFASSKTKTKIDLTPNRSNDLSSKQANFNGNHPAGSAAKGPYLRHPSEVGLYLPNPLGIYDLHGNVWEWTSSSQEGPSRVGRGGSWVDPGVYCTSGNRRRNELGMRNFNFGFRLLAVPSV